MRAISPNPRALRRTAVSRAVALSPSFQHSLVRAGSSDQFRFTSRPYTAVAWINALDLSGFQATYGAGVLGHLNGDAAGDWWLAVGPAGRVVHAYFASSGDNPTGLAATAAGAVTAGRWTHIAAVWDGSAKTIYVDGVPVAIATTSATGSGWGTPDFRIGRTFTGSEYHFGGRVGPAGVWARAISASEVGLVRGASEGYAALPPHLLPGLVSWWDLSEMGGTRLDSHGPNHLAPVNGPGSGSGPAPLFGQPYPVLMLKRRGLLLKQMMMSGGGLP